MGIYVALLPCAMLWCVVLCCRLQVSGLDSRAVFNWALAPMVLFYGLFAAVLLPNADALQPTALAAQYCAQLVGGRACSPKFGTGTGC